MKKLFTAMVVALMVAGLPAKAQFGFGVRGGLNLTNVTFSDNIASNLASSNRAGFFIGPTLKFTVPIIGIGFDVSALYDQRSSKIDDQTVDERKVVLPINVRYEKSFGNVAGIFFKAGPQFGWNVGDKTFKLSKEALGEFELKKSNVSLNLGLGAMLIRHLEIGLTYNIALGKTGEVTYTDVVSKIPQSLAKTRSNAWQLNLAYFF
jgi:hypothetical protein